MQHPSPLPTSPATIFRIFLKLGLTSFGGPIAHLGYFRREFVERRGWMTEQQYAQVLALCQFLPGPASSQLGFSIGLLRAGFPGALAAFVGFTLPSALLMLAFAMWLPALSGTMGAALVHGLKLVAVAVVAHAVITMTKQLCPDAPRRIIAVVAAAIMLLWNAPGAQLFVIAAGAAAGAVFCRRTDGLQDTQLSLRYGVRLGWALLAIFVILLVGLPLLEPHSVLWQAMSSFYRAGALVFGGGHVVLPLLRHSVVDSGLISANDFLAGYGAAQAMPGPMFTLAAYLGAMLPGESGGVLGMCAALIMIFLPGFLLVVGVLPLWRVLGAHPSTPRMIAGINAAVVGLLAAAFYDPVWLSGIETNVDIFVVFVGLLLLLWRLSPLWVVLGCVAASIARSQIAF